MAGIANIQVHIINVIQSANRLEVANRFLRHQNQTEAVEFFDYHPEELPPYYFEAKRGLLKESANLTQFAINDMMAFE